MWSKVLVAGVLVLGLALPGCAELDTPFGFAGAPYPSHGYNSYYGSPAYSSVYYVDRTRYVQPRPRHAQPRPPRRPEPGQVQRDPRHGNHVGPGHAVQGRPQAGRPDSGRADGGQPRPRGEQQARPDRGQGQQQAQAGQPRVPGQSPQGPGR